MSRPASHAGSWYQDDERALDQELNNYLNKATEAITTKGQQLPIQNVKAIIAPHAGFRYSGPTSAFAYTCFDTKNIKRVFILGPSHVCATRYCLLSKCKEYETPLGSLKLDISVIEELSKTGLFAAASPSTEIEEHSIEMHLPFVYKAFESKISDIKIVPIIVGSLTSDSKKEYAKALAPYLKDPETLFIVSSDFCHWGRRFRYTYYNEGRDDNEAVELTRSNAKKAIGRPIYESIEELDHRGIEAIESLSFHQFERYLSVTDNTICGRNPIGVLLAALEEIKQEGYSDQSAKCLKYAQSERCQSVEDSSVSYASIYIQVKQ